MSNKKNHIGEANKMITSVEWLFHKLWDTPKDKLNWYAIAEQAKAMHKEEIIHSYNKSWHLRDKPYKTAEKYYNETFGGNNEL